MIQEKTVLKTFNMCNDAMFKSFFRSKEARKIVVKFLSALTDIKEEYLMKASFQGGELTKEKIIEKQKESDIIVKLDDANKIIIEMNNTYHKDIFKKNSEYAFSVKTQSTSSNKLYSTVILINIDNFNKFNTKEAILHFKLRDEYGNIENDSYNSIHLILENAVNLKYNKNVSKEIVNFSNLLKANNIKDMRKLFQKEGDYMKAIDKVEELSEDKELIGYYDVALRREMDLNSARETGLDEGRQLGIIIGKEEGIKEGIQKTKMETVKKMFQKNYSFEEISDITNISVDEIKSLIM